MSSLNYRIFWLFIYVLAFNGCKAGRVKPIFTQLGKEENVITDVENKTTAGTISIIVENYRDNEYCIKHIDSMAFKAAYGKNGEYLVQFYKFSKITNVNHLLNYPKDLYRYSNNNDHIFSYYWSDGNFLIKQKIKNGKLVEVNKDMIRISDIPYK